MSRLDSATNKSVYWQMGAVFLILEMAAWFLSDNFLLFIGAILTVLFLVAIPVWINQKASLADIGLKPFGWSFEKRTIFWFLVLFFSVLGVSIMTCSGNSCPTIKSFLTRVAYYYPWAIVQQIILLGYFGLRLRHARVAYKKRLIVLVVLFSLMHIPNPLLMFFTALGGVFSVLYFERTRNLYYIALGHALVAPAIMYLPNEWHHHLAIGLNFLR